MASSADTWMKEYNEAVKLSDDITAMVAERSSRPGTGADAQRHASAIRRKITILGTRLDSLETLLTKLPGKQQKSEKEMNRRRDMLANLRSKVNQMASTLNMSNFANRDTLLGPEIKQADAISRTTGLDNHGVVGLQRQIMREQDEGLEKLEETVISTKHIALAVNEELDLHARLIDDLDEHVEVTDSRLQALKNPEQFSCYSWTCYNIIMSLTLPITTCFHNLPDVSFDFHLAFLKQRVMRNVAILNKRTKGGCSCMSLLFSVIGIVVLIVVIWLLIKYL